MGALPALCTLTDELPKDVTEDCAAAVLKAVLSSWEHWKSAAGSGGANKESGDAMSKLLQEACITFPFEATLAHAQQELASLVTQKAGQEKMEAFVVGMQHLVKQLELDDVMAHLDRAKALAVEAEGVDLPLTQLKEMQMAWGHFQEAMHKFFSEKFEKALALMDFLLVFRKLVKDPVIQTGITEMDDTCRLREALMAFEGQNAKVEDMLRADDDKQKLRTLVVAAKKLGPAVQSQAWSSDKKALYADNSQARVQEAEAAWSASTLESLQKATHKISHLKNGTGNEDYWTHGLPEDCSWAALLERASQTIKAQSGEELVAAMTDVEQVTDRRYTQTKTRRDIRALGQELLDVCLAKGEVKK